MDALIAFEDEEDVVTGAITIDFKRTRELISREDPVLHVQTASFAIVVEVKAT